MKASRFIHAIDTITFLLLTKQYSIVFMYITFSLSSPLLMDMLNLYLTIVHGAVTHMGIDMSL